MCANADWQDCMLEKASAIWFVLLRFYVVMHLGWATTAFSPRLIVYSWPALAMRGHVESEEIWTMKKRLSIYLPRMHMQNNVHWRRQTTAEKWMKVQFSNKPSAFYHFQASARQQVMWHQARQFGCHFGFWVTILWWRWTSLVLSLCHIHFPE